MGCLVLLVLVLALPPCITSQLLAPSFIEQDYCSALGLPGRLDGCGLCALPGEEGRGCTCDTARMAAGQCMACDVNSTGTPPVAPLFFLLLLLTPLQPSTRACGCVCPTTGP